MSDKPLRKGDAYTREEWEARWGRSRWQSYWRPPRGTVLGDAFFQHNPRKQEETEDDETDRET